MTRNESTVDRVIRLVLGLGLGAGAVVVGLGSALGIMLAVLAAVMLITAAVGFCPLYRVFGLSTATAAPAGRDRVPAGR